MTRQPLYPLSFMPIYKEKVWGGRRLQALDRDLPGGPDSQIGESWELVDLATTSVSGGGGNAEHSLVANGPLAGSPIQTLIADYGGDLLGALPLSPQGGFPLLLKLLDASENLSVQVHPSPAYAAAHPDAFLKSEAWYIVDCDPGAVIYKGVREGVTPDQFRAAIEQNTDDAVVPLMISIPVKPGDCHYLPSGTCHALGAGILVAEVQTPSDTTFRVYDWGRTSRELHVEQAMQCIHFGPAETEDYEEHTTIDRGGVMHERLVLCDFFQIERAQTADATTSQRAIDQPELIMLLAGSLAIAGLHQEPQVFEQGSTILLPPALERVTLQASAGARWLRVSFPQLPTDNALA